MPVLRSAPREYVGAGGATVDVGSSRVGHDVVGTLRQTGYPPTPPIDRYEAG